MFDIAKKDSSTVRFVLQGQTRISIPVTVTGAGVAFSIGTIDNSAKYFEVG